MAFSSGFEDFMGHSATQTGTMAPTFLFCLAIGRQNHTE